MRHYSKDQVAHLFLTSVLCNRLYFISILQKKEMSPERLGNFPKDTQLVSDKAMTLATPLMGLTSQERQTYKQLSLSPRGRRQDIESGKGTQILLRWCVWKNSRELRFRWGFKGWVGVLQRARGSKAESRREQRYATAKHTASLGTSEQGSDCNLITLLRSPKSSSERHVENCHHSTCPCVSTLQKRTHSPGYQNNLLQSTNIHLLHKQ